MFRGAFTALVTPMLEDGSVDYGDFRKLVKSQLEGGINGLVPLGTTAETPTLEEDEEDKIIEIVFEEVRAFEKANNKKNSISSRVGLNCRKLCFFFIYRAQIRPHCMS